MLTPTSFIDTYYTYTKAQDHFTTYIYKFSDTYIELCSKLTYVQHQYALNLVIKIGLLYDRIMGSI